VGGQPKTPIVASIVYEYSYLTQWSTVPKLRDFFLYLLKKTLFTVVIQLLSGRNSINDVEKLSLGICVMLFLHLAIDKRMNSKYLVQSREFFRAALADQKQYEPYYWSGLAGMTLRLNINCELFMPIAGRGGRGKTPLALAREVHGQRSPLGYRISTLRMQQVLTRVLSTC
jgi:hypothetical protein